MGYEGRERPSDRLAEAVVAEYECSFESKRDGGRPCPVVPVLFPNRPKFEQHKSPGPCPCPRPRPRPRLPPLSSSAALLFLLLLVVVNRDEYGRRIKSQYHSKPYLHPPTSHFLFRIHRLLTVHPSPPSPPSPSPLPPLPSSTFFRSVQSYINKRIAIRLLRIQT